jgi:hypothetical protein
MPPDPKQAFKALADDATFATTAHVIALNTFGDEIYNMDPLEVIMALEDEYKVEVSEDVAEKLQAILLATTTSAFFEDPVAFRAIANTLIEGEPGFDGFDDVTIPEILWSVYEVELNHEGSEFSPAVTRIIQEEIENDGEDIDSMEEAMSSSYHQRAVRELRFDLAKQLAPFGVTSADLPPVD